MGLGGKTSSWKWPFKIRGKYRTIGIMENFDAGLDSVSWFPVANGDNKTEINAKVFPGALQMVVIYVMISLLNNLQLNMA
jgi:ribosome-binding ATPase YchF (GTP1/OBG family)